jgi:hypothetical protein
MHTLKENLLIQETFFLSIVLEEIILMLIEVIDEYHRVILISNPELALLAFLPSYHSVVMNEKQHELVAIIYEINHNRLMFQWIFVDPEE